MTDQPGSVALGNTYDKVSTKNGIERRLVDGFDAAFASLVPEKVDRCLEVGCGEGNQMRSLAESHPEATLTGVDIAGTDWLTQYHEKGSRISTADAAALPFADDAFDLVIVLEVLEHVDEPRAVLAEIARVATGTVIISVPWEPVWCAGNLLRGRYITSLGNTPGHLNHFTRRGLLRKVGELFEIDAVRKPLPWTFVRARVRS
jgi:2-polyprenyl-3-methyl-5-hydroxy-6-metoxy-1,4-benzoquinol methylase